MNINETHVLDDFSEQAKSKSKYTKYFIMTASTYLAFTLLFTLFYIQDFSFTVRSMNWVSVIREFVVPVVGVILFVSKKKAGWVICFLYFVLISILFILILINDHSRSRQYYHSLKKEWVVYLDLILAISSTVLLVFREVRNDFKLSIVGFWIWLGVAAFLGMCIFIGTYNMWMPITKMSAFHFSASFFNAVVGRWPTFSHPLRAGTLKWINIHSLSIYSTHSYIQLKIKALHRNECGNPKPIFIMEYERFQFFCEQQMVWRKCRLDINRNFFSIGCYRTNRNGRYKQTNIKPLKSFYAIRKNLIGMQH